MEMIRFRTALGGFNRADVANYIERTARSHQDELKKLRDENTVLRAEKQKALEDVQTLTARVEALSGDMPEVCIPEDPESQELLAYRRAEAAERSANQRIRRQMERLEELMSGLSVDCDAAGEELQALMTGITEDMEKLRGLFGRVEEAFSRSRQSMDELKEEVAE